MRHMKTVLENNPTTYEQVCNDLIKDGYQLSSSSCSISNENAIWCAVFFKPVIPENIETLLELDRVDRDDWNLDHHEMDLILKAMDHFKGDKIKVSSVLGISVSSLYRKLAENRLR
jgi:DNA-binding NtrC family response regulator